MSVVVRGKLPCPSCPSSDAYHEYDDGHGFCFSCQTYIPPPNKTEDEYTVQYLDWRGVNKESFAHYEAKTQVDKEGVPLKILYKYPNGALKIRDLKEKKFYSEGDINKAGLFGRDKFSAGSHKYVTITEGELDAISLYQVLRAPVVSVQSSSTAIRDCTVDRAWLASFERVYLAFDNDSQGRDAAAKVARLFDFNRVYQVKFTKRKDANEYLVAEEDQELRNIWWNSKKYLPETIVSSFAEFEDILNKDPEIGVSYPFKTLTEMTYGIRRGESILITAQEGVGKTEVMHAIEHKILRDTDWNIGAIYLEEPKRRHLQALAGIELKKPVHLPDSGCSNAEVIAAVKKLVRVDERLHVYSHFGSDDPEVLLDTIRFLVVARECPIIFLDHITMVCSGLSGEAERTALDYLSTRLEMMVKELNFALLFVSHVNDNGQTRGSRLASKIADVRIDLTRDVLSADELNRNTVSFMISKPSRFTGKSGPAGSYIFDPYTREFNPCLPSLTSPSIMVEQEPQGLLKQKAVELGF